MLIKILVTYFCILFIIVIINTIMRNHGYLERVYLPEQNGKAETLANFGMRLLTSRAANLLPSGPFVLNKVTNGAVVVMVAGEPEGKVLLVDAEQVHGPLNVTIGANQFTLRSSEHRHRYDGSTHKDLIDKHPALEQVLSARTTELLGEMGLYAGIDIEWWQTVAD
jgi:hypothetical protein